MVVFSKCSAEVKWPIIKGALWSIAHVHQGKATVQFYDPNSSEETLKYMVDIFQYQTTCKPKKQKKKQKKHE